eukprot:1143456-Pelagomonas_calceolata.AAC.17
MMTTETGLFFWALRSMLPCSIDIDCRNVPGARKGQERTGKGYIAVPACGGSLGEDRIGLADANEKEQDLPVGDHVLFKRACGAECAMQAAPAIQCSLAPLGHSAADHTPEAPLPTQQGRGCRFCSTSLQQTLCSLMIRLD